MPIRILMSRLATDKRRDLICQLHKEGFSDEVIGEVFNGLDRTWVYRIRTGKTRQARKKAK